MIILIYSFWKGYPHGPWRSHQPNPAKVLKEGCQMIGEGIKNLMKAIQLTSITVNIGFIGLNFAGGFSKGNMKRYM